MTEPARDVTLRFLAAPTDVAEVGATVIAGGRVLEWIDKAAYACAVGWSGGYCVTAYVGNVSFENSIHSGQLVEARARLVHTGRASMHIEVSVRASFPQRIEYLLATTCTVVFVSVDANGRSAAVRPWQPATAEDRRREQLAVAKTEIRAAIAAAMADQEYTDDSTAQRATLRFLAAPTDVNWGGKTHGGTVMRWIDEAASVCVSGWSGRSGLAVYSGGIRFYRPILIGHVVEIEARLLLTGQTSMHVSVHVRAGDPRQDELNLTTHCLTVFVGVDNGRPLPVRPFVPSTDEDRRLEQHARHLQELRSQVAPPFPW